MDKCSRSSPTQVKVKAEGVAKSIAQQAQPDQDFEPRPPAIGVGELDLAPATGRTDNLESSSVHNTSCAWSAREVLCS